VGVGPIEELNDSGLRRNGFRACRRRAPGPAFARRTTQLSQRLGPMKWRGRVPGRSAHVLSGVHRPVILNESLQALPLASGRDSTWRLVISPFSMLTVLKPKPMVKSADEPKCVHCEPHQGEDAGKS
jgi:hypothetical protein